MKRIGKIVLAVFLAVLLTALLGGLLLVLGNRAGVGVARAIVARIPSIRTAEPSQLLPLDREEGLNVLYEGEVLELEDPPVFHEGQIHLPYAFVKDYVNDQFFYDPDEQVLSYTTYRDVLRMGEGETSYRFNGETRSLESPVVELSPGRLHLPMDLVETYADHGMEYKEELNVLVVENPTETGTRARIAGWLPGAALRVRDNHKSAYYRMLKRGETVWIHWEEGEWVRITTEEGLAGYVKAGSLGKREEVPAVPTKLDQPDPEPLKDFDGKLNLTWHQVTTLAANRNVEAAFQNVRGVNVVSPTWFEIADEAGTVKSIADPSYVEWAHARGMQVWALFSNAFNSSRTHEVLKSTAKREFVVEQILEYVRRYGLDGINIDFESVAVADGPYYVQFVKELAIPLRKEGVVVSVDMYVPSPWSVHYGREEIGKYIDYLIIMGYDEHYSGSEKSGSVASIGFVDKGVRETLLEVPKEKVVLGVPFYARLWKETGEGEAMTRSSQALGMNAIQTILGQRGVVPFWDEETGQYYAEYQAEGATYKIWVEDLRSLEEKMKLVQAYGLAGAASWKLGLENRGVWDVLSQYLE
ncbi:glycosyl hydrolase family 18 protein [Anaerotalea alkaliphila]|uniref:GH18 domain-containing protein n=1 Tax=Anaerotalea alkaliphila TaxID=2662126 RepID=A0A7X5HUI1_9FIRM|nr:glycosyl hydrolase family 18 protein [Anaerotalea alkaliphila]NDL66701.1 hypothetical protein [Anaerotalea alkaliphila]